MAHSFAVVQTVPVGNTHETKAYNIQNYCEVLCSILPICWCNFPLKHELVLEPEEVVTTRKTCCAENVQRKPYGELGSVDITQSCGCCWSVNGGPGGQISPGWGCNRSVVQEIHRELKCRQQTRGDQGQIQRADQTLQSVTAIHQKVDHLEANMAAIMAHLKVPEQPPYQQVVQVRPLNMESR